MSHSTVSDWISAAGLHAGVQLTLGVDGHCRMILSDGGECLVEAPSGGELVFFYLPVLPVPADPAIATPLLKAALAFNMFGLRTRGISLGYDERTANILLSLCARIDELDEVMFCELLGSFVEAALAAKAAFKTEVGRMDFPGRCGHLSASDRPGLPTP